MLRHRSAGNTTMVSLLIFFFLTSSSSTFFFFHHWEIKFFPLPSPKKKNETKLIKLSSNNNQPKYNTSEPTKCIVDIGNNGMRPSTSIGTEKSMPTNNDKDQLANSDDGCANNMENNECDSGGSSDVADDEAQCDNLNSSTEENRDEFENNLNDTNQMSRNSSADDDATSCNNGATITFTEPAVGSDWYLYCDENFTNCNLIEEKIYEDLCYVTFSANRPEV